MNQNNKSNLFRKYFFVISSITIISFMVLGVSLVAFTAKYWRDERSSMLSDVANQVETVTSFNIDELSMSLSKSTVLSISQIINMLSEPFDADVFVTDLKGNVIICEHTMYRNSNSFDFDCIHMKNLVPAEVVQKILENGNDTTGVLSDYYRYKVYSLGTPLTYRGENVGVVFAATPVSSVQPYVNDILQIFLISTAFALLIAFLSAYVLTYKMVTPLRQMAQATRNFSKGDFSVRVPIESHDELGELVNAFNAMALSLATLESTRRSFIANVSHELRTPMTTIGGFIDGILDGTIPPEKQGYYLHIVSDEIKRLSRLVVQMLSMSEIEAGKKKLQPSKFDISKRIFQIFVSFEKRIDEKMIEIRGFERMSNIEVEADGDLIHQVIYNLVDNAIKFTPKGGYIEVSAVKNQKRVLVSIKNSGEGLSPEEAHHVFERFYKVDKSRSKDVKGTGIGLYIVKSIVELHGGQIAVNSQQGEYCEFVFWIPQKFGHADRKQEPEV